MQTYRYTLGDQIRLARAMRRWSQEALALSAGLHRTHIGAIERGEVSPEIGTVEKIAKALGLQIWQLFKGDIAQLSGDP